MKSPSLEPGLSLVVRLENFLGAELLRARLVDAACPLLAGRYEIQGILGRGASGVVVRAVDLRLERDVALKLVPVSGPADEVLREARTLAKLEHRHIVPVYDVEVVEASIGVDSFRVAYVSMRLIEGATMRVWLTTERRDAKVIIEKYVGAASALAAAHRAGVLHRDFKPDNVMIDGLGHPYVVDFGLAAHAAATEGRQRDAHGTFPYMAPEALEGRATHASDQYALAASMKESLHGVKATAHVRRAIERSMHSDPERRFEDVDAFLRSLEPRRPWFAGVGLIALFFLMGAGFVVAGRGDMILSDATKATPEPEATDACEQFPADWEFVTTVDAVTAGTVALGSQGRYEASFRRDVGCRFGVALRRTSDRHAGTTRWPERVVDFGTAPVALRYDSRSATLAGEFRLPRREERSEAASSPPAEHTFRVRFHGGTLRGEFSASPSDRPYSGMLEGRVRTPEEIRRDL